MKRKEFRQAIEDFGNYLQEGNELEGDTQMDYDYAVKINNLVIEGHKTVTEREKIQAKYNEWM